MASVVSRRQRSSADEGAALKQEATVGSREHGSTGHLSLPIPSHLRPRRHTQRVPTREEVTRQTADDDEPWMCSFACLWDRCCGGRHRRRERLTSRKSGKSGVSPLPMSIRCALPPICREDKGERSCWNRKELPVRKDAPTCGAPARARAPLQQAAIQIDRSGPLETQAFHARWETGHVHR